MKLIFEKSKESHFQAILPSCDVDVVMPDTKNLRQKELPLPEISENDLSRHYTELMKRTFGVNDGFYPLGSCTMKYNPKINEKTASLKGFAGIHPLQSESTVLGALEVIHTAEKYLCEITGMDNMTFQPAAGSHGEFTGLLLIKAYHVSRGDTTRTKIIIPDSAHGTNPASASMAGFEVISIESNENGLVDIEKLKNAVGNDTAGLMLTNPNTLGLFDKNILDITKIIHDAGGLNYYDGANLNAILGIVRPGDMGFDVVHLNLHKSFSTPHGGGGPGSGPVGCKNQLSKFLPKPYVVYKNGFKFESSSESIGKVKAFYGNFLVVVKALSYIFSLGCEGIPNAAKGAVLNANYMMKHLSEYYDVAYDTTCMHEFVLNLSRLKSETGVSALDVAKGLQDMGMHPPTMYFPLIVHEALMIEPTETESKETLDSACDALIKLYNTAKENPEKLLKAPVTTPVGRLDEVGAARNPRINYYFQNK